MVHPRLSADHEATDARAYRTSFRQLTGLTFCSVHKSPSLIVAGSGLGTVRWQHRKRSVLPQMKEGDARKTRK
jgi:hypothetical protein